jgi:hypothetical protein
MVERQVRNRKETVMELARVVSFDGVSKERVEEMRKQIGEGEQPDEIPAKEIVMLHDPEGERSLVVLFFDGEEDYRRADETLSAMPSEETPGKRTSVARYEVALRTTA